MNATKHQMTRRAGGFTLIEVLTAVAITLILVLIVNAVISDVRDGVSVATADMQATDFGVAIENRLRDDFRRLSRDGFMVIRNESLWADLNGDGAIDPAWDFSADPATPSELWEGSQIAFFANGPWTTQRYGVAVGPGDIATGVERELQATVGRIWYGHLAVWEDDDTDTIIDPDEAYPPMGSDPLSPTKPNRWLLGRQALLLTPQWATYDPSTAEHLIGSRTPWQLVDVSVSAPADYPTYPTAAGPPATAPATSITFSSLLTGASDVVTDFTLLDLDDLILNNRYAGVTIDGVTVTAANLLGYAPANPYASASPPANEPFHAPVAWNLDDSSAPPADYLIAKRDRRAAMIFRPYGERGLSPSDSLDDLMPLQNVIAPYASTFKVEFAGDYYNADTGLPGTDGRIDTIAPGATPGTDPATPTGDAASDIYWYGGLELDVDPSSPHYGKRRAVNADWIIAPPAYPAVDLAIPNLSTPFATYIAAFGDDETATPWPELVRVTVTLHDANGRMWDRYENSRGTAPEGRTFVYILRVPE